MGSPLPRANDIDTPADYREQGEQFALGALSDKVVERQGRVTTNLVADLATRLVAWLMSKAASVAIWFAERVMTAEDRNAAAFRRLTATAIKDLTGADVGGGHRAIGRTILESLSGGAGGSAGGAIEPSTAGAEKYMEVVMQLALEGYIEGGITSALSAGFLDRFTELDDILANTLGLGRMSRRVMGPLMNARVITPFQWHVNKLYRPELLPVAVAVRQFLRGRWTREQLDEELARQGWSADRIEAHINAGRRFLSVADVDQLVTRGHWTAQQGLDYLKDQGYDQQTAEDAGRVEGLKRIERLEATEAALIIAAYEKREIDESRFAGLLLKHVHNDIERAFFTEIGELRRALNVRYLSSSEVWTLCHDGILSPIDYRVALEREGYVRDAIAAKDLQLRKSLDEQRDLARARAAQKAAQEQERAAKLADRARREAELAARKALPALQDYERAYVRGRITLDHFADAIRREKIAIADDDVALYLADAVEQREAYLAQLEARARAAAKPVGPDLSIAQLEQAVLDDVLTLTEFDARLATREYDDDERRVLTALLDGRLKERDEARKRKAEAEARAGLRGVSLSDFEQAVRLGARSREQFAAFLDAIETPELARGLLLDVLDAQLAQDEAARRKRDERDAPAAAKGISLAQRRRAVIDGVRPRAYYEAALIAAEWPVDDQLVELALLDVEIAAAAAAQRRRDELAAETEEKRAAELAREAAAEQAGATPPPPKTLSLAQYERAFVLGLLSPDEFRAAARGFTLGDADVELLLRLAVAKVPDARDGAAREAVIAKELAAKRISLADFKRAVTRGLRTVDEYGAMLRGEGYGDDDVALLVGLLNDEIVLDVVRLRARIQAAFAKRDDAPALDELEAALADESITGRELVAILEAYDVGGDVARVFVGALRSGFVEA